jgi:hypothetical protein
MTATSRFPVARVDDLPQDIRDVIEANAKKGG